MPGLSSLDPLIPMLDTLVAAVGFRREDAHLEDDLRPFASDLWRSDFAILAIVRVPEADAASLDRTFLDSTDWIARIMKIDEKQGRLIDGYLLLAMQSKPSEALLGQAYRIEGDTSICRKRVLWPDEDGSWSSTLYAVTTLGLPPVVPVSGEVMEPQLPWVANQALEAREAGTSFNEVAERIEELPEHESERAQHAN